MKKSILSLAFSLCAIAMLAQVERPKLVVGLIIDQMRWDNLYYFHEEYGNNGFKRLINEGYSCDNTKLNYTPTITAVGHTSIYTGTVPALNGIVSNSFRENGKMMYCCTDTTVQSLGSNTRDGQMSPRNMWTTTIGDMIKFGIDKQSKVIGVALKDRASILPAGHAADAAYWYDVKAGNFVSSTYYMNELPKWVERFNKTHHTKPGFDIKASINGIKMTFDMAEAILKNERMGKGKYTDMLCVSVSSTDALGHVYGTRRSEMREVYIETDKQIARFLKTLDTQVGKGNYLLFLTADHGSANNANELKAEGIPAGGYNFANMKNVLNTELQKQFGVEKLIAGVSGYSFYLNNEAIAKANLKKADVKAKAIEVLEQEPLFLYVVDMENIDNSIVQEKIKLRMINGYNRIRSGEIQVIARPNYIDGNIDDNYKGTTHSAWAPYDSHIPLIFMGWNVKHGKTNAPKFGVDIAPTVCAMLNIQMPDACVGEAIVEVADSE